MSRFIFLIVCCLTMGAAHAGRNFDGYVNEVLVDESAVIVSDQVITITPSTEIAAKNKRRLSGLAALPAGAAVRVELMDNVNGARVAKSLRLIDRPRDADKINGMDDGK